MLSNELIRLIFEYCNLEGCVALSQVCSSYWSVWTELDESLIRERVVERAPWFIALDTECGLDSWRKCALLLTRRSYRALEEDGTGGNANKHLYVLRNLSVPVSLCCNKVEFVDSVDFSKDKEVRETIEPIFDELYLLPIDVYEGGAIQGTKLLLPGEELDFKTMEVSKSDFPGTHRLQYTYRRTDMAMSPSGLRVVNDHEGYKIRVVDENDSLLHVRYWSQIGGADAIVHKTSHPRDQSGACIVSAKDGNAWPLPDNNAVNNPLGTLVSLVPGPGGALVVSNTEGGKTAQYLAYIEPLPSLPGVVLCELPMGMGFKRMHNHLSFPFFTFYNGYLYLYFEGRFLRLWVDLGLRSRQYPTGGLMSHVYSKGFRGQVLTVWDRRFPAIGTFNEGEAEFQGARIQRKGQFVTVGDAKGLVVGDLKTGTTYFNPKQVLSIPFAAGDGSSVGFFSVDNWVSKKVIKKISNGSSDGDNIIRWWDEACIPQTVRGGDPVFTRVIHSEDVSDEPHKFEDSSRGTHDAVRIPDAYDERQKVYRRIYKGRPPFSLDETTLVATFQFEHFEDHELPKEMYQVEGSGSRGEDSNGVVNGGPTDGGDTDMSDIPRRATN